MWLLVDMFYKANIKDNLRIDAITFQVQAPIVCGISSLGYDHMEILG